jgi:hypothetical protein
MDGMKIIPCEVKFQSAMKDMVQVCLLSSIREDKLKCTIVYCVFLLWSMLFWWIDRLVSMTQLMCMTKEKKNMPCFKRQ